MHGVLWTATGIKQIYPAENQRPLTYFNTGIKYNTLQPTIQEESQLAFGVLEAVLQIVGTTPMILINEPMPRLSQNRGPHVFHAL